MDDYEILKQETSGLKHYYEFREREDLRLLLYKYLSNRAYLKPATERLYDFLCEKFFPCDRFDTYYLPELHNINIIPDPDINYCIIDEEWTKPRYSNLIFRYIF
ncbi:MAG TPA: hypothetical protein DC057_08215 [Spirochaetia bacterium]|nr:hypothetical protein [Spirochaetia bacterium]